MKFCLLIVVSRIPVYALFARGTKPEVATKDPAQAERRCAVQDFLGESDLLIFSEVLNNPCRRQCLLQVHGTWHGLDGSHYTSG